VSSRDPLSETLHTWRHTPGDAPQFAANVWARIDAAHQTHAPSSFYRWVLPLAASVALCAGIGSAMFQTHHQHTQRMAASYAQSIDPLQMHAMPTRQ
jgi:hypothetical protein